MKQAALGFIAENLISEAEKDKMRKIFKAIDKNLDGALDKSEIMEGLKRIGYKNYEQEADRIFAQVDIDGDGEIEFDEWCKGTMNKRKLLGKQSLKKAFDLLDVNGDG